MVRSLVDLTQVWCDSVGFARDVRPTAAELDRKFGPIGQTCRPGADPARVRSWERRFGFVLPEALKTWLCLSDGFYGDGGPLVHPLSAIGPMVPFSQIPGLAMQPECWFEIGNPNRETVCIDLGYRWPGGDYPLFTSGDDERNTQPQLIAPSFSAWFLKVLHRGGAEFWLEPDFASLGDPWSEHRRMVPSPPLAEPLRSYSLRVRHLLKQGADDVLIARELGLSRNDVEQLVRHIQHAPVSLAKVGVETRS